MVTGTRKGLLEAGAEVIEKLATHLPGHLETDGQKKDEGQESGEDAEPPVAQEEKSSEDDETEHPREVGQDDSEDSLAHFRYSLYYAT